MKSYGSELEFRSIHIKLYKLIECCKRNLSQIELPNILQPNIIPNIYQKLKLKNIHAYSHNTSINQ